MPSSFFLPKTFPVTCHTDFVGEGSTFVAINGYKSKGSDFIDLAVCRGATEIILEKDEDIAMWCSKYPKINFLASKDIRKTLSILSSEKLGNPSSKLKIIGITGTKGKTTTTFLVDHILKMAGYKTALLGTIKNKILDKEIESSRTTMGADWLQMFFSQCVKDNVEYVVMEVSSHALSLDRVFGVEFDVACFTNLAAEHMDYYQSLDDYFDAKSVLFDQVKDGGSVVINTDDAWGGKLIGKIKEERLKIISFGETKGDNKFLIKNNSLGGLEVAVESKEEKTLFKTNLFGEFNAYNLTMAFLVGQSIGIEKDLMIKTLKDFNGVPGRLQNHKLKNGAVAFVDYAHNPSSFDAVLKALRPLCNHLIVVFGCGGDRDKTKRSEMGMIASYYGDVIIITDDNPRSEQSMSIIDEIIPGILQGKKESTFILVDRRKAIKKASEQSKEGSVIAILGKGHETYHLVGDEKLHFDDFEEISKY